jgi:hypothetical protein
VKDHGICNLFSEFRRKKKSTAREPEGRYIGAKYTSLLTMGLTLQNE